MVEFCSRPEILQCFYIGALPESATSIMNDVTKPLSWSMPPQKVRDFGTKVDLVSSRIDEQAPRQMFTVSIRHRKLETWSTRKEHV